MLRDRVAGVVTHIGNHDPARLAGGDVDDFIAGCRHRHHFEVWRRIQHRLRDRHLVGDDDLGFTDPRRCLFRGSPLMQDETVACLGPIKPGIGRKGAAVEHDDAVGD